MKNKLPYQAFVAESLIPKLERGVEKGRIELTGDDCEKLLFVFRTSVSLEPFMELFSQLIARTVDDYKKLGKGKFCDDPSKIQSG